MEWGVRRLRVDGWFPTSLFFSTLAFYGIDYIKYFTLQGIDCCLSIYEVRFYWSKFFFFSGVLGGGGGSTLHVEVETP